MGRPNRLLMLLPLLSLLALAAVVEAQHDHARLMEGLTPREQAVMESVIESMDMKTRVQTHVDDLKKEIEKGWTADGDTTVSRTISSTADRGGDGRAQHELVRRPTLGFSTIARFPASAQLF